MRPHVKTHPTTGTVRRQPTAPPAPIQQAVLQAAHEALQRALDRRDNGGETGR